MTVNTNLNPDRLNQDGAMSFMRKLRVSSWHGIGDSNKHKGGFLRHNNSGVSTETRTSGSVVDASEYIRYKTVGAATASMSPK